jgi:uncharacterized protein
MKAVSFRRIFVLLSITLAGMYLAACSILFFAQRSLLYFPTPKSGDLPSISIESEGETIKILTRSVESLDAIILFGGNADDVSYYLEPFAETFPRKSLYLVNYRGYGGSTGTPSEAALFADALAVYDHVRERSQNITIIGRSLGAGVAIYLASVREVNRLVLITPYDSIENVAKSHYPIFPVSYLLRDKFDSASRVRYVSARTLILVAEHDRTIPRKSTDALIRQFPPEQVEVKILSGKTHNSIIFDAEYLKYCRDFLGS